MIQSIFLVLFAWVVLAGANAQGAPATNRTATATPHLEDYRIGPGDDLSVVFPFNAELNHEGPVGPDGRFSLPLAGSLELAGQTVPQAAAMISKVLHDSGVVDDARTSITILHYGANVYIGGEVRLPGLITLSPGMDPMQAVIAAGGLLDTAKTKKIAIIRRAADGHAIVSYVDLRGYMHGVASTKIPPLQPRDVIFVPKSSIAEADRWVDQYLNKLVPFGKNLNYGFGTSTTTTVSK